jgi:exopolysaccharide biosynthesis protein
MKPEGQLVINGVDKTTYKTDSGGNQYAWMDDDMGSPISDKECYPLLIDANGDLSCYASENRKAAENQPAAIISAGYKYAVTGWGMIVNSFTDDDLQHDEIVHSGKYIRQAIGQFQNGDYFVLSCDKTGYSGATAPTSHEAGVTYSDLATFLINKGAKFAYSLDGGGSCETVIGKRQVNPIFDGIVGRAVPTVIYWSAD